MKIIKLILIVPLFVIIIGLAKVLKEICRRLGIHGNFMLRLYSKDIGTLEKWDN